MASKRKSPGSSTKGNNVLTILIPGLKRPIDIQFPDGKLPVCQRCKKIYKTRELCRIRDGHTTIPWNTTYLCLSFDDTCLTLNNMGEMCLMDEEWMQCRYIAQLLNEPPLPFRANKLHEEDILYSPICTACKEKNYTRHHCRVKQQHMELPWVTMYVMLSTVPYYEPVDHMGTGLGDYNGSCIIGDAPSSPQTSECVVSVGDWSKKDSPASCIGRGKSAGKKLNDDIHKVPPSRSCVLTINSSATRLRWLEIDPCVPRTEYRSISSFTGTPSATMHRWHDNSKPFTPVTNSTYSSRELVPGSEYKPNQEYYTNNPYYPHWNQSIEHQGYGPPMYSQGPPATPTYYNYPPDYSNAYRYQQMEHNMRQSYAVGYGRQQFPSQDHNNVFQEMSHGDYYNKYCDYNNVPNSHAQTSARPDPNEQHSANFDQNKSTDVSWSHTPTVKDNDGRQDHELSMYRSPVREPRTYWSHPKHSIHNDGGKMSNAHLPSQEEYEFS